MSLKTDIIYFLLFISHSFFSFAWSFCLFSSVIVLQNINLIYIDAVIMNWTYRNQKSFEFSLHQGNLSKIKKKVSKIQKKFQKFKKNVSKIQKIPSHSKFWIIVWSECLFAFTLFRASFCFYTVCCFIK